MIGFDCLSVDDTIVEEKYFSTETTPREILENFKLIHLSEFPLTRDVNLHRGLKIDFWILSD